MGHNKSGIIFYGPPVILNLKLAEEICIKTAVSFQKEIKSLKYYFVPREKIIEINSTHLNHDYPTDIITFDYCKGKKILGEVFICDSVIKENALDLKLDFTEELNRVVFHGLLHLIGFNDKTVEEIKEMRIAENNCLKLTKGQHE